MTTIYTNCYKNHHRRREEQAYLSWWPVSPSSSWSRGRAIGLTGWLWLLCGSMVGNPLIMGLANWSPGADLAGHRALWMDGLKVGGGDGESVRQCNTSCDTNLKTVLRLITTIWSILDCGWGGGGRGEFFRLTICWDRNCSMSTASNSHLLKTNRWVWKGRLCGVWKHSPMEGSTGGDKC